MVVMKQICFKNTVIVLILIIHFLCAKGFSFRKKKWKRYILQWTPTVVVPFLEQGNEMFIQNQCPFANCYVTNKRHSLTDIKQFDVLLFYGPELDLHNLPSTRSTIQKYIFVSVEPAQKYPVSEKYNGYFNWTWTYKIDSDIRFGFISVRNKYGDVVGPSEETHWLKVSKMNPINQFVKDKLKNKKIAAVGFISNCVTDSNREQVISDLTEELSRYNLRLDIYGACGNLKCPKANMNECLRLVQHKYYFYLAFENALSEDYVTERLLHALLNYAVPVVYGGANYTRFMPDGMYLNAGKLGVKELAKQMNVLIRNKQKYYEFFRWHEHYKYHDTRLSSDTNEFCNLCTAINDVRQISSKTVYPNIDQWWNVPKLDRSTFSSSPQIGVEKREMPTMSYEIINSDINQLKNNVSVSTKAVKKYVKVESSSYDRKEQNKYSSKINEMHGRPRFIFRERNYNQNISNNKKTANKKIVEDYGKRVFDKFSNQHSKGGNRKQNYNSKQLTNNIEKQKSYTKKSQVVKNNFRVKTDESSISRIKKINNLESSTDSMLEIGNVSELSVQAMMTVYPNSSLEFGKSMTMSKNPLVEVTKNKSPSEKNIQKLTRNLASGSEYNKRLRFPYNQSVKIVKEKIKRKKSVKQTTLTIPYLNYKSAYDLPLQFRSSHFVENINKYNQMEEADQQTTLATPKSSIIDYELPQKFQSSYLVLKEKIQGEKAAQQTRPQIQNSPLISRYRIPLQIQNRNLGEVIEERNENAIEQAEPETRTSSLESKSDLSPQLLNSYPMKLTREKNQGETAVRQMKPVTPYSGYNIPRPIQNSYDSVQQMTIATPHLSLQSENDSPLQFQNSHLVKVIKEQIEREKEHQQIRLATQISFLETGYNTPLQSLNNNLLDGPQAKNEYEKAFQLTEPGIESSSLESEYSVAQQFLNSDLISILKGKIQSEKLVQPTTLATQTSSELEYNILLQSQNNYLGEVIADGSEREKNKKGKDVEQKVDQTSLTNVLLQPQISENTRTGNDYLPFKYYLKSEDKKREENKTSSTTKRWVINTVIRNKEKFAHLKTSNELDKTHMYPHASENMINQLLEQPIQQSTEKITSIMTVTDLNEAYPTYPYEIWKETLTSMIKNFFKANAQKLVNFVKQKVEDIHPLEDLKKIRCTYNL